jgi:subtilase family serine protease
MTWISVSSVSARAQKAFSSEDFKLGRPRITEPIDDSVVVTIPGSRPRVLDRATDLGRMDGTTKLDSLVLVLKSAREQEQALQTVLDQQQEKSSPNYHRWLTPDEFGAAFGVHEDDLRQISSWLTSRGFAVHTVARGRRTITFSGTVAQVEEAFHTEMHNYVFKGERHISNEGEISVPAALSQVVAGVPSLDNFFKPKTPFTSASGQHYISPGDFAVIYNTLPLLNGTASGGQRIDGNGVTIAIAGIAHINQSDVQKFRSLFLPPGYDTNWTDVCYLDVDSNCGAADPGPEVPDKNFDREAIVDVEWAGAVAPGAHVKYVAFIPPVQSAYTHAEYLASQHIVDNDLAPVMSVSFQGCEASLQTFNQAFQDLWQQAAAEGITVFVSAGDSGSAGCDDFDTEQVATQGYAVNGVASTPYNVAVGGTEFNENGNDASYWSGNFCIANPSFPDASALGYIPEKVWNESAANFGSGIWAGGGGVSYCSAKPLWQMGPDVPTTDPLSPCDPTTQTCPSCSAVLGQHRYLPDVSLNAAQHDGYMICDSDDSDGCATDSAGNLSNFQSGGGTSIASPAFAGIQALIDEKYGPQGEADYVYYNLAAQQNADGYGCNSSAPGGPGSTCIFNDITNTNSLVPDTNGVPCQGGSPDCPASVLSYCQSNPAECPPGVLPNFPTGPGYDLATGLGSVNALNLFNAWDTANDSATLRETSTTIQLTSPTDGVAGSGQTVTLVANVSVPSGAWGPPLTNDSISFTDQATGNVYSVSLQLQNSSEPYGYTATLSTTSFSVGEHTLTATYYPSGTNAHYYGSSSSNTATVLVQQQSTTLTLAALSINPPTVASGNPATLTASLSGPAPAAGVSIAITVSPQGVVQPISSVAISAGSTTGTVSITALAVLLPQMWFLPRYIVMPP